MMLFNEHNEATNSIKPVMIHKTEMNVGMQMNWSDF